MRTIGIHLDIIMLRFILFFILIVTSLTGRAQSSTTTISGKSSMSNTAETVGNARLAATASLVGDVNGDGKVNAIDVVDIVKYVKGSPRSAFVASKADINEDGVVDLNDAEFLSKVLTGVETPPAAIDDQDDDEDDTTTGTGLSIKGGALANPGFTI